MNLCPDYYFHCVTDIPPDFFAARNMKAAMLDIDNTLAADQAPGVPDAVLNWLRAVEKAGTALAAVSNNHRFRVEAFCKTAKLRFFSDAGKPSLRILPEILERYGALPQEIAVVGDQIFTDVWFAKRAGAAAVLVAPVGRDLVFGVKLKRLAERPLLAGWRRSGALKTVFTHSE